MGSRDLQLPQAASLSLRPPIRSWWQPGAILGLSLSGQPIPAFVFTLSTRHESSLDTISARWVPFSSFGFSAHVTFACTPGVPGRRGGGCCHFHNDIAGINVLAVRQLIGPAQAPVGALVCTSSPTDGMMDRKVAQTRPKPMARRGRVHLSCSAHRSRSSGCRVGYSRSARKPNARYCCRDGREHEGGREGLGICWWFLGADVHRPMGCKDQIVGSGLCVCGVVLLYQMVRYFMSSVINSELSPCLPSLPHAIFCG